MGDFTVSPRPDASWSVCLAHVPHVVVEEVDGELFSLVVEEQESAAARRGVSFRRDEALDQLRPVGQQLRSIGGRPRRSAFVSTRLWRDSN